jgi:hypothetical protein
MSAVASMALQSVVDRSGAYAIDWDVLQRVCRSHVRARAMVSRLRIGRETHLFGPNISWVEVDWDAVKGDVERDAPAEFRALQIAAQTSLERAADYTRTMFAETQYYRDQFRQKQAICSRESLRAIEASVRAGENAVTGLTVIRDFSTDVVMVGATALSGGAALAAIGSGSILKGSYTWEDTRDFSARSHLGRLPRLRLRRRCPSPIGTSSTAFSTQRLSTTARRRTWASADCDVCSEPVRAQGTNRGQSSRPNS